MTQDCILQTTGVITKKATKMAHMHAYGWNMLLTWEISALTTILQLYNSSEGIFSYSFILLFSNLVLVCSGRLSYIAFSVFYLHGLWRGMGRRTMSFFKLV